METWKPVVGFEGLYEVSDRGRVRSLDRVYPQLSRKGKGHKHTHKGRILRPAPASHGYLTVVLGRGNTRTVHSLVAEAFIGPCPEGQEILHKDQTRLNSRLSNLRYGTRTENILDAVRSGQWFSPARKRHLEAFAQRRWHR
jgi:hypothetical protein